MKLGRILIAIPLVVATATPVFAQASTGGQESAASERRVCRSRNVTGSNIRARRVCMLESQWRERDRLDRERVDALNNRVVGACQVPAGGGITGSSCIGN